MNKKIGLFGYGCVGQGLHDVLENSKGFRSDIDKIVVKDKTKKRRLPAHHFSYDADVILDDEQIDLVVELIDSADEAYAIVKKALKTGKNVVSANKKMIAENLQELVQLQKEYNVGLLYEASACGSIPIIRTLEEYYDNELLEGVSGIFNGSSNYILSKVIDEGLDYASALAQAQALGFAESDPTLDVGGFDAKYKLVILTAHAYGTFISSENVLNIGIQGLKEEDIAFAKQHGYKIKLLAVSRKLDDKNVAVYVTPHFIDKEHPLYNVDLENNGVIVEAAFSEKQLFIGKGAGGHPTGSAVLSDISANSYDYKYEYKKHKQENTLLHTNNVIVEGYIRATEEVLDTIPLVEEFERSADSIRGKFKLTELIANQEKIENVGGFIGIIGDPEIAYTCFKQATSRKEAILS